MLILICYKFFLLHVAWPGTLSGPGKATFLLQLFNNRLYPRMSKLGNYKYLLTFILRLAYSYIIPQVNQSREQEVPAGIVDIPGPISYIMI